MAKHNREETKAIQPTEQQRDFLEKAPGNPGGKYLGANLELKAANDDGDPAFSDPFDFSDLLRRGQR